MKPPFRLAPDFISHDTAEALREMLLDAESGDLFGLAFVAMYKGSKYIVNATGEAYRNPTFTRGMLAALDDELSKRIHLEPT